VTARSRLGTGVLVVLSGGGALGAAEDPGRFVNAVVDTRPAGDLVATVRSIEAEAGQPGWIGYAVAALGDDQSCCDCWKNDGRRASACRLEGGGDVSLQESASEPVPLEGSRKVAVLLRVEGGAVRSIRVFDGLCRLDAGGRPVHWLTGVGEDQSLSLLSRYVEPWQGRDREAVSGGALTAIALHDSARADALLEGYAAPAKPLELRKQAAFWMGAARGRPGLEALRRLALSDRDPALREHVAFALSVSRETGAIETIIRMAHEDGSPGVRGQALFWLAQKAGARAASEISRAAEDDPETEVKTRAVFALSRLPRGEGVPPLIRRARTNRNPEVRKQAFFWLGQSRDPRALALFEKVLTR
jgi:hypothetical protein